MTLRLWMGTEKIGNWQCIFQKRICVQNWWGILKWKWQKSLFLRWGRMRSLSHICCRKCTMEEPLWNTKLVSDRVTFLTQGFIVLLIYQDVLKSRSSKRLRQKCVHSEFIQNFLKVVFWLILVFLFVCLVGWWCVCMCVCCFQLGTSWSVLGRGTLRWASPGWLVTEVAEFSSLEAVPSLGRWS